MLDVSGCLLRASRLRSVLSSEFRTGAGGAGGRRRVAAGTTKRRDRACDNLTAVDTPEIRFIRELLEPLCEPLHEVLLQAHDEVEDIAAELNLGGPEYKGPRSHLTRAGAHRRLAHLDLAPWRLGLAGGNAVCNLLTASGTSLRLLRAAPGHEAPAPGSNRARRAAYRNEAALTLDPNVSNLLGVWSIVDATPVIRVVRPVGAWRHGQTQVVDLDLLLPSRVEDLHELVFETPDEQLTLNVGDDDGADEFFLDEADTDGPIVIVDPEEEEDNDGDALGG